jgi:phospho-N-acetylmuramoyl-pentapeptide-transferase
MITVDTLAAVFLSFGISALILPFLIPFLIRLKVGQTERKEGVQAHLKKAGTPDDQSPA